MLEITRRSAATRPPPGRFGPQCDPERNQDERGEGGDDEAADGAVTLNVATVNNPQMKDMESLKSEYEADHPGVTGNFQVMEEGDLRSSVTADVASGAGHHR